MAAALLAGDGTPLLCELRLEDTERPPDTPDDSIRCCLAAASAPRPAIELIFGADWLEHLAEDPADGHVVLGRALAERHGLQLPGPAAEAFLDRAPSPFPSPPCEQGKPLCRPVSRDGTGSPAPPAARARPGSSPARSRFASSTVGRPAVVLCTEVILPAAGKALAEAIADWPRDRCRGNECATPSRERRSSSSVLFRWGHAGAERPVRRGQSTRLRYIGNVGAVTGCSSADSRAARASSVHAHERLVPGLRSRALQ